MYSYFFVFEYSNYDWYIRLDDDVFVNMVAMRYYLSHFDPGRYPYYLGHTLLDRWKSDNIVYNAGNLYAISSFTLRQVAPFLMTLPTMTAHEANSHCADFSAGNDDPHFGACLNMLGIYPLNTMDYWMRNRFMVFASTDHFNIVYNRSLPREFCLAFFVWGFGVLLECERGQRDGVRFALDLKRAGRKTESFTPGFWVETCERCISRRLKELRLFSFGPFGPFWCPLCVLAQLCGRETKQLVLESSSVRNGRRKELLRPPRV